DSGEDSGSGIKVPHETKGALAFDTNKSLEEEVSAYLEVVRQLRKDYKDEQVILDGLKEIETKLQSLRVSAAPEKELRKSLEELMYVPLGEGRNLRLDAFRKKAAKNRLSNLTEYKNQVVKMVRNTRNNLAMLLLANPQDGILQKFMEHLESLDMSRPDLLKGEMETLGKSPQLWHYNKKKKSFLADWLRPYQDKLGVPIEDMTEEEFQAALKQVEDLRQTRFEDMTNLEIIKQRDLFRSFNRRMNPVINGRDEEFWGSEDVRDEFVRFINLLILRFSFNLEERFLVFRTNDSGFVYLVGFSDESFEKILTLEDGRVGLYPHLKVLLKVSDGSYKEITKESYSNNAKAFYSTMRTAVVPFLTSMAVVTEKELSEDIKNAFDIWT
ncbi:MAG: hypothetical protein OEZ59_01980, partial [Deltaproteobacteria bacterium]|nr:hypothetical protein [Deltaproteobacteria bacterium]